MTDLHISGSFSHHFHPTEGENKFILHLNRVVLLVQLSPGLVERQILQETRRRPRRDQYSSGYRCLSDAVSVDVHASDRYCNSRVQQADPAALLDTKAATAAAE